MRQPREIGIPSTPISVRREAGVESQRGRGRQPQFGDILPGRPCPAADLPIPTERREIEKLYAEYDSVVEQLRYSEGMALMRALGYTKSTWLMRRYKHRKPRLPEVVLTLTWVRNGKPLISHKRRLTAALLWGRGPQ